MFISLYKYKVLGVSISDIYIFISSLFIFVYFKKMYFNFFILFYFLISVLLILFSLDGKYESSLKMLLTLGMLMSYGILFNRLNPSLYGLLLKRIVIFLASSQLIIVCLYYSGLADFIFNIILPGNVGRVSGAWLVNVFDMSNHGVVRFGGLFVEPSWFSLFFCFFVFLFLHQYSLYKNERISIFLHAVILLAVIFTLSFSGFIYLLLCYFFCVFFKNIGFLKVLILSCVAVTLMFFIFNNDYILSRVMSITSGEDASTNVRFINPIIYLYELASSHIFFGVGAGNVLEEIRTISGDVNAISFQVAYFNIIAVYGVFFGLGYIVFLHASYFKSRFLLVQMPLFLSMLISSLILTPIYMLFFLFLIFYPVKIKDKRLEK